MNSEKKISKAPPMAICDECGQYRQVHQRDPRVLCRNCYVRLHLKRRKDFCVRCSEWKEIVGRGLCRNCYDWASYHDKLSDYPTER